MAEVTRAGEGFTVEAGVLGAAFGLDPAEVPDLLRAGRITSRCEAGVEADLGRWRLTFFHAGRALRLTVDDGGQILSRSLYDTPGRAAASDTA
ncbi:DUF6522 family protein [Ruixingdingia sedimenti]|uniref:DUF6522 family protein n=1 Tax=Ruixingdingia sedimenti TaxID=3073604 RepID=A0ABU1F2J5_9RHOB|nr:DUF6522 family protein [Xinfangfangia sp. LG-4]MDR5651072.1 DUF6522 family protein [Xinfangfangia sp. LG-4]